VEVEEVVEVEAEVEEASPQDHPVEEEAVEEVAEVAELLLAHHPSQENWEATHQKNSMETERKANHSCSTSSYTEE